MTPDIFAMIKARTADIGDHIKDKHHVDRAVLAVHMSSSSELFNCRSALTPKDFYRASVLVVIFVGRPVGGSNRLDGRYKLETGSLLLVRKLN
ncbi:uncharacterized protein PHALS_00643 [Plasmopara halstedii]|uniref:Uncharacterized protein n=1 Tax=Plasmopara halstedii TaxID=4781 RepID=A0A0P1B6N3_PLAHL|nr:uncharacterized protein PHALS_00643 [Plasmopara halstedii]CEG50504.1 hypothetical protein PHALS_00643 [Plasmopara halstedii]|eukprot:XP_024586873.1 hypothetical protein PHALS_00643 [Plasmopara halstedii]